jgi:hypothetical protein
VDLISTSEEGIELYCMCCEWATKICISDVFSMICISSREEYRSNSMRLAILA